MADLAKPRGHLALRGSGPASPDGKPVQNNRLRAKRLDVRNAAPSALPSCVMNGAIRLPAKSYSDRNVLTGPATVPHQLGDPTKTTSYASMCPILFFKGGL